MYRESRSLPRAVRLTPILEFMRKGRRKGGDCGRSAASPRSDKKARRKSGFRRANMQSEKNQRCFVEMLNVSE